MLLSLVLKNLKNFLSAIDLNALICSSESYYFFLSSSVK